MNDIVNSFVDVERAVSGEKGDMSLFALFVREDAQGKMDVVLAAPWIEEDRKNALPYVIGKIKERLSPEDFSRLSRVVLIDEDNPGVSEIGELVTTEHSPRHLLSRDFFGLPIKDAYIITSKRPSKNRPLSFV